MARGHSYVSGVINETRFPTTGKGAGSATNTASHLITSRSVTLHGILLILPVAAGTITIVDSGGTTIGGLAFTLVAAHQAGDFIAFGPAGITHSVSASAADGLLATAGIKLSNTATLAAALIYS